MVQSEVRAKTVNRNVILNDLFFYTFFPLLKFKWKWSSWPRWIKMQRTWVGLGGIGVFIQTYLKGNRTLNKPRKQHRIHFLKPAFLFFLSIIGRVIKKIRLLMHEIFLLSSLYLLYLLKSSVYSEKDRCYPSEAKVRLRWQRSGCSCLWHQHSLGCTAFQEEPWG